jgi:hypothetical protein
MKKPRRLQGKQKVSEKVDPVKEFLTSLDKTIKKHILAKILDCLEETNPEQYNPDQYFNNAGTTWDLLGGYYLKLVKPDNLEVSKCAEHFYKWKNEIFYEFTKEEIQTIFLNKLNLDGARALVLSHLKSLQ